MYPHLLLVLLVSWFGMLVVSENPEIYLVKLTTGNHAQDVAERLKELYYIRKHELKVHQFPDVNPLDVENWVRRKVVSINIMIKYYEQGGALPGPSEYLYAYLDYKNGSRPMVHRRRICPMSFVKYGWIEYGPVDPCFFDPETDVLLRRS